MDLNHIPKTRGERKEILYCYVTPALKQKISTAAERSGFGRFVGKYVEKFFEDKKSLPVFKPSNEIIAAHPETSTVEVTVTKEEAVAAAKALRPRKGVLRKKAKSKVKKLAKKAAIKKTKKKVAKKVSKKRK